MLAETKKEHVIDVSVIQGSNIKTTIDIPDNLEILESKTLPRQGCGIFRIMTAKDGDKRIVWDKMVLAEINSARKLFDKIKAEGLVPYRIGPTGAGTEEVMDDFDATAEEILFLPGRAIAGG